MYVVYDIDKTQWPSQEMVPLLLGAALAAIVIVVMLRFFSREQRQQFALKQIFNASRIVAVFCTLLAVYETAVYLQLKHEYDAGRATTITDFVTTYQIEQRRFTRTFYFTVGSTTIFSVNELSKKLFEETAPVGSPIRRGACVSIAYVPDGATSKGIARLAIADDSDAHLYCKKTPRDGWNIARTAPPVTTAANTVLYDVDNAPGPWQNCAYLLAAVFATGVIAFNAFRRSSVERRAKMRARLPLRLAFLAIGVATLPAAQDMYTFFQLKQKFDSGLGITVTGDVTNYRVRTFEDGPVDYFDVDGVRFALGKQLGKLFEESSATGSPIRDGLCVSITYVWLDPKLRQIARLTVLNPLSARPACDRVSLSIPP